MHFRSSNESLSGSALVEPETNNTKRKRIVRNIVGSFQLLVRICSPSLLYMILITQDHE